MKKEKGKAKKTDDPREEKKDSQPRKSKTKFEAVNVVTHDRDSGNDVLFISSCLREHALLADIDGDMTCTLGYSILVLLFMSPLIVSCFQIT